MTSFAGQGMDFTQINNTNLKDNYKTLLPWLKRGLNIRDVGVIIRRVVDQATLNEIASDLLKIKTVPKFKCSNYRRCLSLEDAEPKNAAQLGDEYSKVQFNHTDEKDVVKAVAHVPRWHGFEYIPGILYNTLPGVGGLPGVMANMSLPEDSTVYSRLREKYPDITTKKRLVDVNLDGQGGFRTGVYRPCTSKKTHRVHDSGVHADQGPPYVCMKDGYQLDIEKFDDYLNKQQQIIRKIEESIDKILQEAIVVLSRKIRDDFAKATGSNIVPMYTVVEEFIYHNKSYLIAVFLKSIAWKMINPADSTFTSTSTHSDPGTLLFSPTMWDSTEYTIKLSEPSEDSWMITKNSPIENMFIAKRFFFKVFAVNSLANGIRDLSDKNDPKYHYNNYSDKVASIPAPLNDIAEFNDIMNRIDLAFDEDTPDYSALDSVFRYTKDPDRPDMSKHLTLYSDHTFRDLWEIFNDIPVYKNMVEFGNRVTMRSISSLNTDLLLSEVASLINSPGPLQSSGQFALESDIATLQAYIDGNVQNLRNAIARILIKSGISDNVTANDILTIAGTADAALEAVALEKIKSVFKIPTATENEFLNKLLNSTSITLQTGSTAGYSFNPSGNNYNLILTVPEGGGAGATPTMISEVDLDTTATSASNQSATLTAQPDNKYKLSLNLYIPQPSFGSDGSTLTIDPAVTVTNVTQASSQGGTLTPDTQNPSNYKLNLNLYTSSHNHSFTDLPSILNDYSSANVLNTLKSKFAPITAGTASATNKYITKSALDTDRNAWRLANLPTDLKNKVSTAISDISSIKTRLTAVENSTDGMTADQLTAFQTLQNDLSTIQSYFNVATGYLSQSTISGFNTAISDLVSRVDSIEGNESSIMGRVSTLENDTTTTNLQSSVDGLQTSVTNNTTDINNLKNRTIQITDVATLQTELDNIKTNLATATADILYSTDLSNYITSSELANQLSSYLKVSVAKKTYITKTMSYIIIAAVFFILLLIILLLNFM